MSTASSTECQEGQVDCLRMGKCCCVMGCSNRFSKGCGLHFYRFPVNPERKNSWVAAVNRKDWQPTEFTWICRTHFVGGKKSDDPVSPAYVSTLFKYVRSPAKRKALCQLERYERTGMLKKRRLEAQCEEAASNTFLEASTIMLRDKEADGLPEQTDSMTCSELEVSEDVTDSCEQSSCSVMTDMTVNSVNDLERECDKLREENLKMKQELKSLKTIIDNFFNDIKKVCYFTGLPSIETVRAIFDYISPHVPNSRSVLPAFQQFVMVLMKLRLNADNGLLSSLFNVHVSTVTRYFQKWIDVMFWMLKPLVKWPDHEQLYQTMPREFRKNFSKCVVVIDCFEVFMERPKGLMARAQTWSNYKHHNTVKFLIGIAPQGSITFISKGGGGVYRIVI